MLNDKICIKSFSSFIQQKITVFKQVKCFLFNRKYVYYIILSLMTKSGLSIVCNLPQNVCATTCKFLHSRGFQ